MKGDQSPGGRTPATGRALLWTLSAVLLLAGLVVLAGVGLVAFLGRSGDDTTWTRWSSVGEAFGVVNSVVSALAVAALVLTWLLQSRDLREQRAALDRTTDAKFRELHVQLTRMAIEDPDLAAMLPSLTGTDPTVQKQHMFANLLLQHVWLQFITERATHEEMVSNLRFLFANPRMRAYWRDSANSRHSIYVDGTKELSLAGVAEEIWREYDAVLACSGDKPTWRRDEREWAADDLQTAGPTAGPSPPPAACPE